MFTVIASDVAPVRILEAQGLEQRRVNSGKDRSVGADAKRQSEHRNQGKSRVLLQRPASVAQVLPEDLQLPQATMLAVAFLGLRDSAKGTKGSVTRLLRRHAAAYVLFGEQREMSLDFLVEFERKTFDAYMDVKELLERLFQRRVDLVVAEAVKPQLRPRILQEVIYAEGL